MANLHHPSQAPNPYPEISSIDRVQRSNGSDSGEQIQELGRNETPVPALETGLGLDLAKQESADFQAEQAPRGRKVLSGTRRAAQNRNAQKAFRQRRDKYVKDLEATAAQVPELKKTIEKLELENTHLRKYTLALQARVMQLSPTEVFTDEGLP